LPKPASIPQKEAAKIQGSQQLSDKDNKAEPQRDNPDVMLRFIYPNSPLLMIDNTSNVTASKINLAVALWNIDNPKVYYQKEDPRKADLHDPLQIPTALYEFLKPNRSMGPLNLFGSETIVSEIRT
jgi:hypothetical protein